MREKGTFMTKEHGSSSLHRGYVVTAAGFGVWFIGWGSYSLSFGVFLKPIIDHFGWTRADTTLAYSLMFMVQAIVGILMGWLTDRMSPKFLVVAFGSFLGLSYFLLSTVNTLWEFHLGYVLLGGIGTSVLNIPVMVAISRWFTSRRGLMTGIVQAGAGIGGFLIPPLAGWLITVYGWRQAYGVLGVITLLGMLLSGSYLHDRPKGERALPKDSGSGIPSAESQSEATLLSFFTMGRFWALAGIFGSFGFCRATFLAHIAAHVQDLGFTLADGANVLALISGFSILGRIGMGRVADKIGNRASLVISFAATAAILLWGLTARSLWMFYVFGLVFGFGWGSQAVLRFTFTMEVFGLRSLGLVMGLLSFSEALAATFGSYIGGYVFDLLGTYDPVFWAGTAVAVGGVLLSWKAGGTEAGEGEGTLEGRKISSDSLKGP